MGSSGTEMKIVARKKGTLTFLLDLGDNRGQVVSVDRGRAFKSYNLQSILARGYWEPHHPTIQETKQVIALLEKAPQQ